MHNSYNLRYYLLLTTFFLMISSSLMSQVSKYDIDATLVPNKKLININQKISFSNPFDRKINEIYLLDWINAYKSTKTPLAIRFAEDYNRSFYLSLKSKLGSTFIDSIFVKKMKIKWERLEKQPDVIKVFLPKNLKPNDTISFNLSYSLNIPDSKFTGMGISDSGLIYLKHWNIALAPIYKNKWLLHSNLNLEDYSGMPSDFNITWNYPKNLYLTSNLINSSNNTYGEYKTSKFSDYNQLQADFVFNTKNNFKEIQLENGKTIVTDLLPKDNKNIEINATIERVVNYADSLFSPFPNKKILILKSDYFKNPYYGLNQLQTEIKISKEKSINIKFFSDTFFYEIKFLKAYYSKYINQMLTIDKRKEHWITGGIQTYSMIKYIEDHYPNEKFLGKLADFKILGVKPLKSYSIAKLGFNDVYEYIYEFAERSNLQQVDLLSKEKLTKLNQKIASPNHVGVGLRYIESINNNFIFSKKLKKYVRSRGLLDFETHLNDDNNLNWFFDDYLSKRRAYDIQIRELKKNDTTIEFKLRTKNKRSLPLLIGLVKEDKLIKSKWIRLNKKDTIISWESEDADYVVINPFINFPESNKENNWKSLKSPFNIKPLKFTLVKDGEDLKKQQVFFHPVFDFNVYDGITTGLRLYNSRIKNRPFEFDFHPQYTFIEKDIVGFFKTSYKLYKSDKRNYLTYFRLSGSSFHYNSNYRYSVLIPSISWYFRPENIRDNKRQLLKLAWYNVFREKSPNMPTNPDYSILNISHIFSKNNTFNYLSSKTSIELSEPFGKIQFSGEARKLFPSGRQLSGRLFIGKFFWHKTTETQFFDFNLNRPTDYLFKYRYLGRSETSGVYSQQFISSEGGFKSKFNESTANDFMISFNASMGLWKWIEIYGDAGILKNIGRETKTYFDSGIKLNFSPDYLEIYLPIFSSNGFDIIQPRFATKIRFILDPGFKTLTSLFTRSWF